MLSASVLIFTRFFFIEFTFSKTFSLFFDRSYLNHEYILKSPPLYTEQLPIDFRINSVFADVLLFIPRIVCKVL